MLGKLFTGNNGLQGENTIQVIYVQKSWLELEENKMVHRFYFLASRFLLTNNKLEMSSRTRKLYTIWDSKCIFPFWKIALQRYNSVTRNMPTGGPTVMPNISKHQSTAIQVQGWYEHAAGQANWRYRKLSCRDDLTPWRNADSEKHFFFVCHGFVPSEDVCKNMKHFFYIIILVWYVLTWLLYVVSFVISLFVIKI